MHETCELKKRSSRTTTDSSAASTKETRFVTSTAKLQLFLEIKTPLVRVKLGGWGDAFVV